MPSKKNKHVKYRTPEEQGGAGSVPLAKTDSGDGTDRPPTAEERAVICAQAIVKAQLQSGAVTEDGMVRMFLRQLLEHEDYAYDRIARLARHMAEQDDIEDMAAKDMLEALAKELDSLKQPPPPAQPGVHLT